MIRKIKADGKAEFEAIAAISNRGGTTDAGTEQVVREILDEVRKRGDAAVREYSLAFDGFAPERITLTREDMQAAFDAVPEGFRRAIVKAGDNIRRYHEKQIVKGYSSEGADGVLLGQVVRGLSRVGLYVPGGTAAYPSTVLMNAIPAKIAGVDELIMVTPPAANARASANGTNSNCADVRTMDSDSNAAKGESSNCANSKREILNGETSNDGSSNCEILNNGSSDCENSNCANPYILAAAFAAGVDRVMLIGGAQAVAALAYGTETVPKVDKIVGPGNVFVATAKRMVFGLVDIDMIAGPSEILIMADAAANPAFIAADLLSQAEHDVLAASILLTTDEALADRVEAQIEAQLERLERQETARTSIADNGLIIVCRSDDEMADLANHVAPEHLEVLMNDCMQVLPRIRNAGSVFLGPWSPEPLGDYYAGANHVLPTSGTARFSSPLGVYDFVKRMSYTCYTEDALRAAKDDIIEIGSAEGLTAHTASIKIRFEGE